MSNIVAPPLEAGPRAPRLEGTLVCAVFFLDVVGYSKRPVSEQLDVKLTLNAAIGSALENLPAQDVIALDTGDGIAIAFLYDIELALVTAFRCLKYFEAIRTNGAPLEARIGVNLGPVRLVRDINGQANVIGDGINVAQRIMQFAEPGQVLASRQYYEMIGRVSNQYSDLFVKYGRKFDKHVRAHELYELQWRNMDTYGRVSCDNLSCATAKRGTQRASEQNRMRPNLRAIWACALAIALLATSGSASYKSSVAPKDTITQAIESAQIASVKVPTAADRNTRKGPTIKRPSTEPGAIVRFAVSPWGEVLIDGKLYGVSPPLTQLRLPAGTHRIEVRNAQLDPHLEEVQLVPYESMVIRHRFLADSQYKLGRR